jgi:hypothetical protein
MLGYWTFKSRFHEITDEPLEGIGENVPPSGQISTVVTRLGLAAPHLLVVQSQYTCIRCSSNVTLNGGDIYTY